MKIRRIIIDEIDDPVVSKMVNSWATEFNKNAYKMNILLKWIEAKSRQVGITYRFEEVTWPKK